MKARSDGATKRRSDGGDLGIVALTLLVLVGVASAQSLEELPGYERYRELTRATRTLATGGVVRDVNWTEDAVYFTAGGQRRRCDLATGEVADFDGDEPEVADEPDAARRRPARGRQRRIEPSPDGVWKAECRDDNVVLIDVDTGEELTLTTGGHRKHRFGRASWVYGEELRQREAMWWSPDSTKLAWYEFDETAVPDFILLSGLTDLRPETLVEGYPKPGEPNPVASLHVHDLATGETVRVDSGPHDGIGHYVFNVRFSPDGSSLIFSRTNRAQNILEVVAADPMTGAGRVLVRETQDTWQRNRPVMQFLDDGRRFIWETEASGYRHYELRDMDGQRLATLTRGAFPCQAITHVDEAGGVLYFTAYGGAHPLNAHLFRVNLDGTDQRRLTTEPLNHTITMSPDTRWFIARGETITTAPITTLYTADGARVAVLAESDTGKFDELGLVPAEPFECIAADGVTTLYGVLYKPSDFDPGHSYPLLLQVYGGPYFRQVRNRYNPVDPTCELGFLVAKLDNRGTPDRGKAFESATYERLGSVDLDDQVAGVRALCARPYVDANRVGVFGHSYGGSMAALGILRYPDVFRAAVAMSGVTDWRNYDTIYTERFMRTPEENPQGYDDGSCMTYAADLEGRLLIMQGLVDDNVHPTNAWQLVAALQDEGKVFDTMFFPERGHALGRGARARRMSYFWEHLVRQAADRSRRRGGRDAPRDAASPSRDRDRGNLSRPPS